MRLCPRLREPDPSVRHVSHRRTSRAQHGRQPDYLNDAMLSCLAIVERFGELAGELGRLVDPPTATCPAKKPTWASLSGTRNRSRRDRPTWAGQPW